MNKPEKTIEAKTPPSSLEWWDVLGKYKELIQDDPVFKNIKNSIEQGHLTEKQKEELLKEVGLLTENLIEYHDSYVSLKGLPGRRFYFEDTQKLQESAKAVDQREKILHDAFVDKINILSRKMKKLGLDNSWRGHELIYGLTLEANRQKAKLWMFKLFREKI